MCGRSSRVRLLTRHHIIDVAWFMRQPLPLKLIRNAHANIVPLCEQDHRWVHHRERSERIQARRHLRRCLSQQEIAFCIAVRGKEWLDTAYPRL